MKNSNIVYIERWEYLPLVTNEADYVDELTLEYDGNRLIKVTDDATPSPLQLSSSSLDFVDGADSSTEYTYVANGNLKSDANRGITQILYHSSINLPAVIAFNNGRKLQHTYDASGRKLRTELTIGGWPSGDFLLKSVLPGDEAATLAAGDDMAAMGVVKAPAQYTVIESRDYLGNYEFTGDNLERFNTPYGFFVDGEFFVTAKDYQGNVIGHRGTSGSLSVQDYGYYPYGLPVSCDENILNRYLYGEKEFELRQGLNTYDFLARTYAPDEARFWQPDPEAYNLV